jgi:hypothetical protein
MATKEDAKSISKLSRILSQVLEVARERSPWIPSVRIRHCPLADRDHRKKWRQFAHSLHVPGFICFAREAAHEMTEREIFGMTAHELGHIVAMKLKLPEHMKPARGQGTPKRVQDEADTVAELLFGIPIRYNRRTLQEV